MNLCQKYILWQPGLTYSACGLFTKNKELVEELYKSVIKKFNKRKVNSPSIDTMWGADLGDMQLISKFNDGFRSLLLLCVVDIYSTYAWVIPLKDKKGITKAFQKFLEELNRKPKEIWVDKSSEFYNRSMS